MDNLRFILLVVLGTLVYMLWEAWQLDYGPKPVVPTVQEQPAPTQAESVPIPKDQDDIPVSISSPKQEPEAPVQIEAPPSGQKIRILTDLFHLEIDALGGTITRVDLLNYPVSKEDKETPVTLQNGDPAGYYVAQSGILSSGSGNAAPNHRATYQTESTEYRLAEGEKVLQVPLTWNSDDGIEVVKVFTFGRNSYRIDIEHRVTNNSKVVWKGRQYGQLIRKELESDNDSTFIRTYTGGVIYNEEDKYEKISFEDMFEENLSLDAKGGWSAVIQHYFLTAWIPPAEDINHFYTKALSDQRFMIGSFAAPIDIQPGEQAVLKQILFSGPKIQQDLEVISPGLELTVDYGFLTVIAKPIFWLLGKFHGLIGNWGWSIICVTLVIKLLFFKLSETSYRSMARMRKIQPKMQAIRDRFGDDKQRMNQEIMGLYKKEKVNPLGGCFPILVQIPVFISLYWVLLESVELRLAPFIFWLDDLSTKDPLFILPLLMGVSMWIQQQLNPTPIDPVQEKVMKLFPVVFTVFFMFFPSGLVLYWVVNNSLSILQQWYITRKIESGEQV